VVLQDSFSGGQKTNLYQIRLGITTPEQVSIEAQLEQLTLDELPREEATSVTAPTILADAPAETKAEKREPITPKQFLLAIALDFPVDPEFPMDAVDSLVEKMSEEVLARDASATRNEKPPDLRL